MGLDLHQTIAQVEQMSRGFADGFEEWKSRLVQATEALRDPSVASGLPEQSILQRVEAAAPPRRRVSWLVAGLPGGVPLSLADGVAPPSLPYDHVVVATDGSQIYADRHGTANCFLINVGGIRLRYGSRPSAELFSQPKLFSKGEELVWVDSSGLHDKVVDESLVGLQRTAMEAQALADYVEAEPGEEPIVALLDGSLVLWELSGRHYPEHVRERILRDGLLDALTRIKNVASRRSVAVASYISRPRSTEVANVLRVASCPHKSVATEGCDNICGVGKGKRECEDAVSGLTDLDIFAEVLEPGDRSRTFASSSDIVVEYEPHEVRFFYLNVQEETIRLEMPQWVADDPAAIGLLHAAVVDQCAKGSGYPVALQEAHERAVLTAGDRRAFWMLVEQSMRDKGLETTGSQKARSKRLRAI